MKTNLQSNIIIGVLIVIIFLFPMYLIALKNDINAQTELSQQEVIAKVEDCRYIPAPTATPTCIPTPTSTPTPTPTPTPICEITNEQFYNECVARGMVNGVQEEHLQREIGGFMGESGRETYYNLKMDLCVWYMRELGYDEIEYPYWIRSDGAKMLGNYVMVAANWKIRPKGTIIPTSLGDGIVVDTGEFVVDYPYGVDIAVDW